MTTQQLYTEHAGRPTTKNNLIFHLSNQQISALGVPNTLTKLLVPGLIMSSQYCHCFLDNLLFEMSMQCNFNLGKCIILWLIYYSNS